MDTRTESCNELSTIGIYKASPSRGNQIRDVEEDLPDVTLGILLISTTL
jgi:hypothetical protein